MFSTDPGSVWFETGHTTYLVPLREVLTTRQPNRAYVAQADQLTRIINANDGLIVIFRGGLNAGDEIGAYTSRGLAVLANCEGITIMGVADSPSARNASAALCRLLA